MKEHPGGARSDSSDFTRSLASCDSTLLNSTLDLTRNGASDRDPRVDSALPTTTDPLEDPLLEEVPVRNGFRTLGDQVLLSRIGRGGMGVVYRARDLRRQIDVAVKCLKPGQLLHSPLAAERFEREVCLGSSIDHPNVVQVLRHGTCQDLQYMVMEYVHGETLRQRVHRRGPSSLSEALGILRRAARGLAAVHRAGLVHRDIKPDNLMLGAAGEVKVCDLGLAKSLRFDVGLTSERSLLGSPRYMAPEQWIDSRTVGPAADVYGLGATGYFLLAGRDHNQGKRLGEILERTRSGVFADIRELNPRIPAKVAAVIARCVQREPAERYVDCGALADELSEIAEAHGPTLVDAGRDISHALRGQAPVPGRLAALTPEGRVRRRALDQAS